ncbi:PREDICTED: cannabinoid receptor 2 [Elephantulus edwardii]|uniref:cannabinoid receptor 2 n=1 Tax=Elephantulus edwardii TaxID=28737 RepID=UPI0003F0782D|nr:PREDICTED: cannabinoid receptor 2 [Elephantulus edwardii]
MEQCLMDTNVSKDGLNFNIVKEYMILTSPQRVAVAVLCTFLGLLSSLENLAVFCLILSTHQLRAKPSYLFFSSLAGADFLASVVFACSFIHFHVFNGTDSRAVFLLKIGSVAMAFTASVGSLMLTAVDRFLCLHHPPAYKTLLTPRRALVTLGVMWFLAALVSYLPLMGWTCCPSACSELFPLIPSSYLLSWLLLVVCLFSVIIYTYGQVLWKAHQHVSNLTQHKNVQMLKIPGMRLDLRLAKTLGVVLAVLLICWSPALALMAYSLATKLSDEVKKGFAFCSILCLVNSMVNPIIYALWSRDIRSSARHCLAYWTKYPRGRGPKRKETLRSSVTEIEACLGDRSEKE